MAHYDWDDDLEYEKVDCEKKIERYKKEIKEIEDFQKNHSDAIPSCLTYPINNEVVNLKIRLRDSEALLKRINDLLAQGKRYVNFRSW